jgi:hypothetical protein
MAFPKFNTSKYDNFENPAPEAPPKRSGLSAIEAVDPYAVLEKTAVASNAALWEAKKEALRNARTETPDKMERISQALLAFGAPTGGNNWAALSNAAKSLSMSGKLVSDAERERANQMAQIEAQRREAEAAIRERYGLESAKARHAITLKEMDSDTGFNPVTGALMVTKGRRAGETIGGGQPAPTGAPDVVNVGGAKFFRDQKGELKPLPKEPLSSEEIADRAAQVIEAKRLAEAASAAKVALPTATNAVNQAIKDVKDLIAHPGMPAVIGLPEPLKGGFGFAQLPGTSAAGFEARYKKVKGGSFLQAREALRGGGQITDFEGKKAEDAMAAMDKAQNETEFIQALNDYNGAMTRGLAILANAARGNFTPLGQAPAAPASGGQKVRSFNPKTGKIE